MRIIDKDGAEVISPDLKKGHLIREQLLVAIHPREPEVSEQWHYETTAVYPNGGKDIVKVIDVPFVAAKEAWNEYEDILRYVPYSEEELKQIEAENSKPTMESRVEALELVVDDMVLFMADLIGGE